MSIESNLLSKLKSKNPTGIHKSLSLYFQPILNPSANINTVDDVTSFKSLVIKCFTFLGTGLCKSQSLKFFTKSIRNELFEVYELCLRALDAVLLKLNIAHNHDRYWLGQQVRFIKCLEIHGRFNVVENHGLTVLERVKGNHVIRESMHCLVLEIYLSLFKTSPKSNTTKDQHCKRLLKFMEEAKEWQGYI
jgi:hypothetical protein